MRQLFSTQDIASLLNVEVWKMQRLFLRQEIPDVDRFAGKRAIPSSHIPVIIDALRKHKWLNSELKASDAVADAETSLFGLEASRL